MIKLSRLSDYCLNISSLGVNIKVSLIL